MDRTEADLHSAISRNILDRLRDGGIPQSALARAVGISPTGMSYRLFGKNRWRIVDVYRAAEFFGCRLSDLFPVLPVGTVRELRPVRREDA